MFFKTCQHYSNDELTLYHLNNDNNNNDINKNNNDINKKECFICLEIETHAEEIIRLREIYIIEFFKKCNCDGYTHIGCLQKWCNLHNKCPICRENIEKRISCVNYIHVNKILLNFYLYKTVAFFKIFSVLYSIYIFCIFCECIFNDKNKMNGY